MTKDYNLPRLDLRQLTYFLLSSELGSISAGAAALGLAPATVSEGIARLEDRLGAQLASRGANGLTMTAAGMTLVQHAPGLLKAADALADAVGARCHPGGPLSLVLPPSLNVLLSVPLSETVKSEYPEVRLRVPEGMSGDVLDWIFRESVDMGFAYEMAGLGGFSSRYVYTEELWFISAPDFLPDALSRTPEGFEIGLAQLPQLPLVTSSKRHKTRQLLEQYARSAGVALNIASELESHSQILEMVLRASAYTIVPKAAILPQLTRGDLVAIRFRERLQRRCYLLRKTGRVVTAASLAVEETAISILKEMNKRHALDLAF
ncbi:LysR family transcriptional regulator [Paracoccus versutus]|uniref:LysR family nitrogen assimilation transcriptional regulator n=1 Tax=Paracoccus versutus TaxID=34007 RepID=A0A3D9XUC6_PARVE|nr:LysR family transcriptional regulator [Paracoccus versutus]REF73321.1 LysR family nitrogen assimilation transcriptional regulator [Paracoccus versutus]